MQGGKLLRYPRQHHRPSPRLSCTVITQLRSTQYILAKYTVLCCCKLSPIGSRHSLPFILSLVVLIFIFISPNHSLPIPTKRTSNCYHKLPPVSQNKLSPLHSPTFAQIAWTNSCPPSVRASLARPSLLLQKKHQASLLTSNFPIFQTISKMVSHVLTGIALLLSFVASSNAIPTISTLGSKFFDSTGAQFYIKGKQTITPPPIIANRA